MIPRQDISLRRFFLWCLIVACAIITVYLCFISIVFVWIGFEHTHKTGFWVPILSGLFSLCLVFYTAIRIIKHALKKMQEDDVVNI